MPSKLGLFLGEALCALSSAERMPQTAGAASQILRIVQNVEDIRTTFKKLSDDPDSRSDEIHHSDSSSLNDQSKSSPLQESQDVLDKLDKLPEMIVTETKDMLSGILPTPADQRKLKNQFQHMLHVMLHTGHVQIEISQRKAAKQAAAEQWERKVREILRRPTGSEDIHDSYLAPNTDDEEIEISTPMHQSSSSRICKTSFFEATEHVVVEDGTFVAGHPADLPLLMSTTSTTSSLYSTSILGGARGVVIQNGTFVACNSAELQMITTHAT